MSSENTFFGWSCSGKGQPLEWKELPLKQWEETDVEMEVSHCGICGSDIHVMDSGWEATNYPCVVGHEIVGICTRVGKNVKHIHVGDRIGVGAQSWSCGECEDCLSGNENICPKGHLGTNGGGTYNGRFPTGDNTYGGYANKWRGDHRFVFKIPCSMTNEMAACFFCAGVTTYAPLRRSRVKAGDRVGVIGIGGLGHFAIQWIRAMGAEVVALSHSDRKREDAMELGCDDYIVTHDVATMKKNANTLTHIICTSFANNFDWSLFLNLLKSDGEFIMVAIPETPLQGIPPLLLAGKQLKITGSIIGSPRMIEDMLQFAANTDVQPWINKYPMKDAPAAVQAVRDGKPRYRIVLENEP
ncbi:MAG: chaperonin 10-like protein [Benjaminiella poitrasii]|nr:MAG: chaperonin 10-like protein [Benjaminiella poitrasii]